jgi:hypothetical protein
MQREDDPQPEERRTMEIAPPLTEETATPPAKEETNKH